MTNISKAPICCGTCQYSVPNLQQPETQSVCMFNPPIPYIINLQRDDTGKVINSETLSIFPVLLHSVKCGQYKRDAEKSIEWAKREAKQKAEAGTAVGLVPPNEIQ